MMLQGGLKFGLNNNHLVFSKCQRRCISDGRRWYLRCRWLRLYIRNVHLNHLAVGMSGRWLGRKLWWIGFVLSIEFCGMGFILTTKKLHSMCQIPSNLAMLDPFWDLFPPPFYHLPTCFFHNYNHNYHHHYRYFF